MNWQALLAEYWYVVAAAVALLWVNRDRVTGKPAADDPHRQTAEGKAQIQAIECYQELVRCIEAAGSEIDPTETTLAEIPALIFKQPSAQTKPSDHGQQ